MLIDERPQSIISNYYKSTDLNYLFHEFDINEQEIDREHYFKFEITDFSRYFLKNYHDLEFVNDGNRESVNGSQVHGSEITECHII